MKKKTVRFPNNIPKVITFIYYHTHIEIEILLYKFAVVNLDLGSGAAVIKI